MLIGKYILSLDQGTTSSRAVLFDAFGGIAGMGQQEFPQIYPQPGYVEHDAVQILNTTLFAMRQAVAQAGGAGRLALDVQRLRMDFRLPARSGEGEPLTGEALAALMERENPAVFFSQDLCARYFTYAQDGDAHFVLFDDADTLRQKLRIGAAMGFSAAFFMWPEVQDIAPQLFSKKMP